MNIRKLFSLEKGGVVRRSIGALRFRLPHSSLLQASLLLLILLIAVLVRLLPLRWGLHLSEFDPHYQYRLAKDMVENGFFAWTSWRDTMAWYPYGRNMTYALPGLPATSAIFYLIVRALGLALPPMITSNPLTVDPFFNFCVIFPVIMGALTCLVIYFLGKDMGGKAVGLFSAFFLALNSSYIGRTSLGFFDDESVGIFGILLFILFFFILGFNLRLLFFYCFFSDFFYWFFRCFFILFSCVFQAYDPFILFFIINPFNIIRKVISINKRSHI